MASSKVMPSSSSTSTSTISDLNQHNHNYNSNFHHNNFHINRLINNNNNHSEMIPDHHNSVSPMTVEGMLDGEITLIDAAGAISAVDCEEDTEIRRKTAEEVWREIVEEEGGEKKECKVETGDEMMTLEDFLARATAGEEGVKVEAGGVALGREMGLHGFDQSGMGQLGFPMAVQEGIMGTGTGMEVGIGGGRRGKRSRGGSGVVVEPLLDKASQQRQRRMIKNRESAARSRERKQAYQVELEALAAKLEEENELLLKEKADRTKQRYRQLMEKVVPVEEKSRVPRTLRRVRSMQW